MANRFLDFVAAPASVDVAATYTMATVADRADFAALAADWKALEAACGTATVFQTYDWCALWLDAFAFCDAPNYRARIATVRDETGRLIVVFPLCLKARGFVTFAEWIGQPLCQYGDILLAPGVDLPSVRAALARSTDVWTDVSGFRLRKVRADSNLGRLITLDRYVIGVPEEAAILNTSDFTTFDDFLATQSSRARKHRRSKRRKLETVGPVAFDVLEPGPAAAAACETAIAWKLDWLNAHNTSSRMFSNPTALNAFRAMAADTGRDSGFRAFVLRAGDTPVAIECSFVAKGSVYAFLGAFDPDLDTLSVGKLQMEDTVRHVFEAGHKHYDLFAPITDYKESWSSSRVGVTEYAVPLDLPGLVYVNGYIRGLRPLAKWAYDHVPETVRTTLIEKLS